MSSKTITMMLAATSGTLKYVLIENKRRATCMRQPPSSGVAPGDAAAAAETECNRSFRKNRSAFRTAAAFSSSSKHSSKCNRHSAILAAAASAAVAAAGTISVAIVAAAAAAAAA